MPPRRPVQLDGPQILDIDPDTGRIKDDADTSALENDQDRLLNDVIQEFDASDENVTYRASVSRIPKGHQKGMKEPWLFDCDAAEIHGVKTKLRDGYGGGIFRVRVYRNGKLCRQFDISIEVPEKMAAIQSDNPAMQALVEQMRGQGEAIKNLTERLLDRSSQALLPAPVAPVDPMTMMEKMSVIMANLGGKSSHDGGIDMFLKAAAFVKELKGESGGDSGAEDNIYTVIANAIQNPELVKGLAGGGRQPMRQFPPGQRRPMQRQGMNGNRSMMQRRQIQQPFQEEQIPDMPQNANPQQMGQQLQQTVQYLIRKASMNSDPSLYAEWLLDNTPEHIIAPMVNNPETLDQLCQAFAGMVPYRTWFSELLASAKSYIEEGAGHHPVAETVDNAGFSTIPIDDNSGRASGNQSQPQNYGAPSPGV